MPTVQIPIDLGFYESEQNSNAIQNSINLYPDNPQTKGTTSTGTLKRTPGITRINLAGLGPGRGMYKFKLNDMLFAVSGNELYTQTNIANPILRGTISGTERVTFASNPFTVVIQVAGGSGYFYDVVSGVLTEITDSIYQSFQAQTGGIASVASKDNRFAYNNEAEWFIGSVETTNNGRDFDALDFEDSETESDPIIRLANIKNELYTFGSETIEVYGTVGGTSFPFQRIQGATIEKGLTARFAFQEFDNSFMFLGSSTYESPAIWRGQSGTATKVSTAAMDAVIQNYTLAELQTVFAMSYAQDGGLFCAFTFPNETFVYDATASAIQKRPLWHTRKSNGSRWRVNDISTVFGHTIVQDQTDGRMGDLHREYLTEYDEEAIDREFTGMYLLNNSNSFRISSVELGSQAGIGNASEPNPLIEMQFSIDGGNTFISAGSRKLGEAGEYLTRQIWRRIGRVPYSIVLKFKTSAKVSLDFTRLDLDIK